MQNFSNSSPSIGLHGFEASFFNHLSVFGKKKKFLIVVRLFSPGSSATRRLGKKCPILSKYRPNYWLKLGKFKNK
jgi:hypothetical protein